VEVAYSTPSHYSPYTPAVVKLVALLRAWWCTILIRLQPANNADANMQTHVKMLIVACFLFLQAVAGSRSNCTCMCWASPLSSITHRTKTPCASDTVVATGFKVCC
jgi:hypothetical protein